MYIKRGIIRCKIENQQNIYTFITSMITLGQLKLIKNMERQQMHTWLDNESHGIYFYFYNRLFKFKLEQRTLSQAIVKKKWYSLHSMFAEQYRHVLHQYSSSQLKPMYLPQSKNWQTIQINNLLHYSSIQLFIFKKSFQTRPQNLFRCHQFFQ